MKSTVLWALVAINAILLASFIHRLVPDNMAMAQQAAAVRRTGDYLLVPIRVNGSSSGIVVALDQTNSQLSALAFNESSGRVEPMPKIDLKRIFSAAAPVAPRAGRAGYAQ